MNIGSFTSNASQLFSKLDDFLGGNTGADNQSNSMSPLKANSPITVASKKQSPLLDTAQRACINVASNGIKASNVFYSC